MFVPEKSGKFKDCVFRRTRIDHNDKNDTFHLCLHCLTMYPFMSNKYTTILTSLMTLNVDSFCMDVSRILIFQNGGCVNSEQLLRITVLCRIRLQV